MLDIVDNGRFIELNFNAPAYAPNAIALESFRRESNYLFADFVKETRKYEKALGICPILTGGFIVKEKYNEINSYDLSGLCDFTDVFFKLLALPSISGSAMVLKVYFKLIKPVFFTPNIPKPSKKRKRTGVPKGIRNEVFKRDDYTCVQCWAQKGDVKPDGSKVKLEIDHKKPLAKGGTDEMSNLQTLCQDCNRNKNDVYQLVGKWLEIIFLGLIIMRGFKYGSRYLLNG